MRLIYLLIPLLLVGCGEPSQIMTAEFSSMDSCLSSIEKNSGGKMRPITDKPGEVSGTLSNGANFGCTTKTSGTKGIYVEGWYSLP